MFLKILEPCDFGRGRFREVISNLNFLGVETVLAITENEDLKGLCMELNEDTRKLLLNQQEKRWKQNI